MVSSNYKQNAYVKKALQLREKLMSFSATIEFKAVVIGQKVFAFLKGDCKNNSCMSLGMVSS